MTIIDLVSKKIIHACQRDGRPFFISLCGSSDVGKSSLAAKISANLSAKNFQTDCLSTDAFLTDRPERYALGVSGYNPQSVDAPALKNAILSLRKNQEITYHPYDNRLGRKSETSKTLRPADIVILEGIHAFHNDINALMDLKIFIDADEETLKRMRYRGNLVKRGMDVSIAADKIEVDFIDFKNWILPNKKLANILIKVDADFNYEIAATESVN